MPILEIIIGFFIGLLCGIIPLVFGLLKKSPLLGGVGIVASAIAGALFNALNGSPFSAVAVAVLFIFIIIATNKRKEKMMQDENENDDEDSYSDDIDEL